MEKIDWDKIDGIYKAMRFAVPDGTDLRSLMYATISMLYDVLACEKLKDEERVTLANSISNRIQAFANCLNAAYKAEGKKAKG